jgi:hypothetical protein
MADDKAAAIESATRGGVSGTHSSDDQAQVCVAPSTATELNTIRLRLIPIACFRVDDLRFRFDSSFIILDDDSSSPHDIRAEMEQLARLMKANPGAPISIFCHADPVGDDSYNKVLSGRRAIAIYGLLTRDTSRWEALYSGPKTIAGDNWGKEAIDSMQQATGLSSSTPRGALMKAYMDKICGADFKLVKTDFLGRGADTLGRGDFQGCGEFNPVLVFSEEKQKEFEKGKQNKDTAAIDARNAQNAPNRRVMILMFRAGCRINPARWPCPAATQGSEGCKKRFFSDGEKRRSDRLPNDDRTFIKGEDTFACRFYQRISDRSPCEALGGGRIRILLDDPFLGFLPGVQVKVKYSGGTSETVATDAVGSVGLLVDRGDFADLSFSTTLGEDSLRVFILLARSTTSAGAWQRLVNLGYIEDSAPPAEPPDDDALSTAIAEYQAQNGIVPTGSLDDATASAIDASYSATIAWKDENRTDLQDSLAAESASLPKDAVS